MSKEVLGIAASSGIAIAKAYCLKNPELKIEKLVVKDVNEEIKRLNVSLEKSKQELLIIKELTQKQLGEEKAEIFSAHLLVLNDPELITLVEEKVKNDLVNAEFALQEVATMFITMFETMENEYMRERASDIRDVTNRILANLLGVTMANPSMMTEEVIVIAEDLTPSDTAQLNRRFVKGFTTDIGGRTSHSAIMARSMEIPAVVGTKVISETVKNGDVIIIDGIDGKVLINPSEELLAIYQEKKEQFNQKLQERSKLINEKTITKDGYQVELAANIGTPDDLQGVKNNGSEGIGLYRTEFLYMGRTELPTEDEQFNAYKTVLEEMEGKPVVVRTLDIGGDKELPYLDLPKELNPFLGFRAIRLCLERKDIFKVQLRALLKASVYGNLKIMFPMIATLEEFRQAKALLEEEKNKLLEEGISVSDKIELGIMVEIPSTAVMADLFAKEVDFFSIGTNDLIQYTMASDRMNEQVSYLYQPYNPAILRLIKMVIDAAHKEGKWAGMCGEMAGDEIAIPLLIGLGLDEFSMSPTSILQARNQIRNMSKLDVNEVVDKVLNMQTCQEVESFVKERFLQ